MVCLNAAEIIGALSCWGLWLLIGILAGVYIPGKYGAATALGAVFRFHAMGLAPFAPRMLQCAIYADP